MAFVRSRGVDVHYVAYGASREWAEHTVAVLHGYTLDHRSAQAVFEPAFRGRDSWRRLYLDLPGMGRTRAPESVASTDDVLDVTSGAVDELVDGPYALAGISYGGYIAAGLVAADPGPGDRPGAGGTDGPGPAGPGPRRLRRAAPRRRRRPHRRAGRDGRRADGGGGARIREEIDAAVELADEAVIERLDARYAGSFPLSPPGGYDRPTLVLLGRQDDVLGYADQWAEYGRWPRATFVVLDRAGHLLPVEQVPLTDVLIADWLDRIEQPPPD